MLRRLLVSGTVVALLGLLLLGCSGGSLTTPLPSVNSDHGTAQQPISPEKAKRGTSIGGDAVTPETEG